MRLADLPAGTVVMDGSVATAVEARELREGDLLDVGGTTVTITGNAAGHDLSGMTRVSVSYRLHDNETVRTERWTLPGTGHFAARRLLRSERVECGLCEPGGNSHDVLVDRVTEGWVRSWVCDAHLTRP
ncbi:hypothetical protein [Streptomyces sp. CAU 1734]|uniref:hypothetical protein n=1 Tax=Streptomyces sp. CAU 1734 TaxID=3140360 RepID=UPI0032611A32